MIGIVVYLSGNKIERGFPAQFYLRVDMLIDANSLRQ